MNQSINLTVNKQAPRRILWSMGTCLADASLSRPHHELSTASHPHSEVKPRRARIVQTWGTRLEVLVLRFFAFFADDNNVQAMVSYTADNRAY